MNIKPEELTGKGYVLDQMGHQIGTIYPDVHE